MLGVFSPPGGSGHPPTGKQGPLKMTPIGVSRRSVRPCHNPFCLVQNCNSKLQWEIADTHQRLGSPRQIQISNTVKERRAPGAGACSVHLFLSNCKVLLVKLVAQGLQAVFGSRVVSRSHERIHARVSPSFILTRLPLSGAHLYQLTKLLLTRNWSPMCFHRLKSTAL